MPGLARDPATADRVRAMIRTLGLVDRVTLVGDLDAPRLSGVTTAQTCSHATLQETYGMAVAEALARGLPVVSTTTGEISALVGDDAGLLVRLGTRKRSPRRLRASSGMRVFGRGLRPAQGVRVSVSRAGKTPPRK